MAKKVVTVVELTDDIDGGKADETVTFVWDGVSYEIDLSKRNHAAFRRAVKPYVDAARRVRRTRRSSAAPKRREHNAGPAEIREWARANGHSVSDRGRVPRELLEAYTAAH
jgi:Lsr2